MSRSAMTTGGGRVPSHGAETLQTPRDSWPHSDRSDDRPAVTRRGWLAWVGGTAGLAAATVAAPLAWAETAAAAGPSFYDSFAGMRLLDQAGRPLALNTLRGKAVIFNFIFTGCSTVCPVQTHALGQMLKQMKPGVRERVHLVSVSLDPLGDTPQTLTAFAKRYQIDHANWSFVIGRPEDTQRLAETLWLFRDGKGKAPLEDHSTSLWLVDSQGALRVRFAGNPLDTARIARELTALVDAPPTQDRFTPNPNPGDTRR